MVALYISFEICYLSNLSLPWSFAIAPLLFILGETFHSLCRRISHSFLENISQNLPIILESPARGYECNTIMQHQYQQFQQDFAEEHLSIHNERTIAEQEKLQKILDYTRTTFLSLDFTDAEIFMVCKSVEYFVTHHSVLKSNDICIAFKSEITQIALKNFAWNIANQYHLRGLLTAEFVVVTFEQWFKESTITTVAKNLRTTNGKHAIEINEHICR